MTDPYLDIPRPSRGQVAGAGWPTHKRRAKNSRARLLKRRRDTRRGLTPKDDR